MRSNVHSCSVRLGKESLAVAVNDSFADSASPIFKEKAKAIVNACKFLEQFDIAGHFTFGYTTPAMCVSMTDIAMPVSETYVGDTIPATNVDIPASLCMAIYAGLVKITDGLEHIDVDASKVRWADATDEIDWGGHVVLSVEYRSKDNEVMYGVYFYKEDSENVLRLVGSYDAFGETCSDEKGNEITPPKGVAERLKKVYGKRAISEKVRELGDKRKSD